MVPDREDVGVHAARESVAHSEVINAVPGCGSTEISDEIRALSWRERIHDDFDE